MPAPTGSPDGGAAVEAVHKRYGRRAPWVLQGVDLALAPGTVTQVSGGNGSGKSTLLRVVAGLTRPTSGRVRDRLRRGGHLQRRRRLAAHDVRRHGAVLLAVGIWLTVVVANSGNAVQAAVAAVTVGGDTRLRLGKLLTAWVACGALAGVALL